jgi:hypothetical protein
MKTVIYYIVFLAVPSIGVNAQKNNITGDTIFVNTEQELQIKFPSDKIEYRWLNLNPPYTVSFAPNSLLIHAKTDSAKCSTLSVFEGPGPRNHSLIVCYNKDISKDLYDYSTVARLQQRIKEISAREEVKIAAGKEPSADASNITALLQEGDKEQQNGLFDQAQAKYEKVLQDQPGNEYAAKQLNSVKEKRSKISQWKTDAIRAVSDGLYEQAIAGYSKVLELSPNDLFSQNQIEKIKQEKRLANDRIEQRRRDSVIDDLQAKAEKAYREQRYDDAIAFYQQCLNLNPIDKISKSKKEAIEKIKSQVSEQTRTFTTYVTTGDQASMDREWEVAQANYMSASKLKPGDQSIAAKLQIANEKILMRQKEDEYQKAIIAGDLALQNKDLEKAKTAYTKASEVFTDSTYPSVKLAEVNKAIAHQKEQADIDNRYTTAIEKGDKELAEKEYSNAKTSYSLAASLKPEDGYAKNKLAEIDALIEDISRTAELNKNYDSAMARGSDAYNKKDYNTAKTQFIRASELKPAEQEPKIKLQIIDDKLNPGISTAKYDSAISKGNRAIHDQNLELALQYFTEANRIKPAETYPLSQLKYVQGTIKQNQLNQAQIQAEAIKKAQKEISQKRFYEGMDEYTKYERAATILDYEMELVYLKNFLNIIPDTSYLNTLQFTRKIEDSKQKIKSIRDYFARTKGSTYQCEAIPYLDVELEKKYGSINFTALPDGQKVDSVDSATYDEYVKVSKEILLGKPDLSFPDSFNNVKLTCVAIKVKKGEAFYKFQIQNRDTTEFLTGSMQLDLVKKGGDTVRNNANYISSFPIVLPGKEFYIIYAAKDVPVSDDDVLSFDISDRLRNYNFRIAIPGAVYNKEKARINTSSPAF